MPNFDFENKSFYQYSAILLELNPNGTVLANALVILNHFLEHVVEWHLEPLLIDKRW